MNDNTIFQVGDYVSVANNNCVYIVLEVTDDGRVRKVRIVEAKKVNSIGSTFYDRWGYRRNLFTIVKPVKLSVEHLQEYEGMFE